MTGPNAAGARRRAARALLWHLSPWLTALAVLAGWEGLAAWNTRLLPSSDLPAPTTILGALGAELGHARFWLAVEQTLKGWSFGLALAFLLAVPVGIGVGSSRSVYRSVRALVELLRPIPGITLLPLLVLLVGLGFDLKLVLVTVAAFWPLFIQSLYGVQDVDPVALEMARAYGLGRGARFRRIVMPGAAPYIVTGLRISATSALNVGIAVELLVGSRGIGTQLSATAMAARIPTMYAYIVTACLLALAINLGIRALERRLMHWHASQRRVSAL